VPVKFLFSKYALCTWVFGSRYFLARPAEIRVGGRLKREVKREFLRKVERRYNKRQGLHGYRG